jgi:hypothetical protein
MSTRNWLTSKLRKYRPAVRYAAIPLVFEAIHLTELAEAHSWYPAECCHDQDCVPVDSVRSVSVAGGGQALIVRSKLGGVLIAPEFPRRDSKDGRMHICMGPDGLGNYHVYCLFVPPSM